MKANKPPQPNPKKPQGKAGAQSTPGQGAGKRGQRKKSTADGSADGSAHMELSQQLKILQKPQNATNEQANGSRARSGSHDGKNRQPRRGSASSGGGQQSNRHNNHHDRHVEEGIYPNPWWRTLTAAELRWQKLYRALPPVEDVAMDGGLNWLSFVRQDSTVFEKMIKGRLTGHDVLAVLGGHEASAARRLNMPHSLVGHEHALNVLKKLSEPSCDPPAPSQQRCGDPHDENSAAKSNRMLVLKYNSGCAPYSDAKIKPASRPRTTAEECPRDAVVLRDEWSVQQLNSGLFALGHYNPHGMVEECGLSVPDLSRIPAEWGFSAGDLPPLASAPRARLKTTRNRDAVEKLVEVKSICPFVYISSRQSFAREHKPPADSVLPWWLPNLQWDLFFEDVQEACMVSQSATRGMNIFTVKRNDEYVRLMLALVRDFYHQFVLSGEAPPTNFFWDRPEHQRFIKMTLQMAEQSSSQMERVSTVQRATKRQPFFIDRPVDEDEEDDDDENKAPPEAAPSRVVSIASALKDTQQPVQPAQQQAQQQPSRQQMGGMQQLTMEQMAAQYGMTPEQMAAQYGMTIEQMAAQMQAAQQQYQQQYQQYMYQQQQLQQQMQNQQQIPQVGTPQQQPQVGMPHQQSNVYSPAQAHGVAAAPQHSQVEIPQYTSTPLQHPQQTPAVPTSANGIPANAMTYEEQMAVLGLGPATEPESLPAPQELGGTPGRAPSVAAGPSAVGFGARSRREEAFTAQEAAPPEAAPPPQQQQQLSERDAAMLELQRMNAAAQQPAAPVSTGYSAGVAGSYDSLAYSGSPYASSFGQPANQAFGQVGFLSQPASGPSVGHDLEAWSDKPGDDEVWSDKPAEFEDMVSGMLDFE